MPATINLLNSIFERVFIHNNILLVLVHSLT